MTTDWLVLIFLVPFILVPIVLLCGFAGCGLTVKGTGVFDQVPSNLNATASGTDTINLSWKDNSVSPSVFIVERGPPGPGGAIKNNVNGATFVDHPPNEGTTFFYDVRATAGVDGHPTAPSNTVLVTTFPAAPTNLVATLIGPNQVQLSWNNASATATKFSLEHRLNPTSGWTGIYKGTAKTSPPTPLTPAGTDEYRVFAIVDGYDNNVSKEIPSNSSAVVSGVTSIPITPTPTHIFDSGSGNEAIVTAATQLVVEVWGAGGSGRFAQNIGRGGGGGAYSKKTIPGPFAAGTIAWSVGAGGAAQTNAGNNGKPGGSSTAGGPGQLVNIANVGGGAGGTATTGAGGLAGTGGDTNTAGGAAAAAAGGTAAGPGGGAGGNEAAPGKPPGGGGGSGAANSGDASSGAGANGRVKFTWS
jgi:hypothetical protein